MERSKGGDEIETMLTNGQGCRVFSTVPTEALAVIEMAVAGRQGFRGDLTPSLDDERHCRGDAPAV
jgi:hypothetical protein